MKDRTLIQDAFNLNTLSGIVISVSIEQHQKAWSLLLLVIRCAGLKIALENNIEIFTPNKIKEDYGRIIEIKDYVPEEYIIIDTDQVFGDYRKAKGINRELNKMLRNKQENIYTEYQETIETTTSCEDSLSSVNIYPNPTKDVLNITFSNKEENIRQVQIASTMGTIMLNIANPTKYAIDINNIPSGLYIVKIINHIKILFIVNKLIIRYPTIKSIIYIKKNLMFFKAQTTASTQNRQVRVFTSK